MKAKYVLIGFLAGVLSCLCIAILFVSQPARANHFSGSTAACKSSVWSDSLDAVKADPQNHKVVFENNRVRILEVFGGPHAIEPLHTHRWPSIMWAADSNFTRAKLIYYHCGYDSIKKTFYVKDSFIERGPPPNIGFELKPEGPHRVTSLSEMPVTAYRVEFKN